MNFCPPDFGELGEGGGALDEGVEVDARGNEIRHYEANLD